MRWPSASEPCHGGSGQIDDGKPRLSEDDIQRALLGPRGVPDAPDPARMTPQQAKNISPDTNAPHTA